MMLTYLFDACAAVELYAPHSERTRKAVHFIVEQRKTHKQAVLLIPNFCIAEVFNTFARKHFKEGNLDKKGYEQCLERFRNDIHWGRALYAYDLSRYHIIAVDEIIPIEHHVASEHDRDHLSTFDILVIAMACELAYLRGQENTFLVTCDRRIKKVSDELKSTDLSTRESWKVSGALDDRSIRRWLLPNVLYLPGIKARELTPVQGQAPINL